MEQHPCGRCRVWNGSREEILKLLNDEGTQCNSCAYEPVIRTVTRQFRWQVPQWGVVNGEVVLPVWIVERLQLGIATGIGRVHTLERA